MQLSANKMRERAAKLVDENRTVDYKGRVGEVTALGAFGAYVIIKWSDGTTREVAANAVKIV